MDKPKAAFFQGTPVLSVLDFLERLAPFSEPLVMLKDGKPRMSEKFKANVPVFDDIDKSQDGEAEKRLDPFGLGSK